MVLYRENAFWAAGHFFSMVSGHLLSAATHYLVVCKLAAVRFFPLKLEICDLSVILVNIFLINVLFQIVHFTP